MKTLFRICTVLMFAGTASLMAADEEPAKGTRGPRMQERGERGPRGEHGPRGGHGRFSMLICPNCGKKIDPEDLEEAPDDDDDDDIKF